MFFVADLLEKVGELVEKLFDLDEELMRSWITAQAKEEEDEEDAESRLDVALCLLEAAKQLRLGSETENLECFIIYYACCRNFGISRRFKALTALNCFHRSESPNGLEVYLHALQLLTTIDEGIQTFGKSDPHSSRS